MCVPHSSVNRHLTVPMGLCVPMILEAKFPPNRRLHHSLKKLKPKQPLVIFQM